MPNIRCSCGITLAMEFFQAGLEIACDECGRRCTVPALSVLRRLDGDDRPFLDAVQKLVARVRDFQAPFDGKCCFCRESDAQFQRTLKLKLLDERVVADRNGLEWLGRRSPIPQPSNEEYWTEVEFPLSYCALCSPGFSWSLWTHRWRNVLLLMIISGMVLPSIFFLGWISSALLGMAVTACVTAAIAWQKAFAYPRWCRQIPLLDRVLREAMEFRIRIGNEKPVAVPSR